MACYGDWHTCENVSKRQLTILVNEVMVQHNVWLADMVEPCVLGLDMLGWLGAKLLLRSPEPTKLFTVDTGVGIGAMLPQAT